MPNNQTSGNAATGTGATGSAGQGSTGQGNAAGGSPSNPPPNPTPNPSWNLRAGPVFKYGLAIGIFLILLGGLSFGLSLTNRTLEMLVICSGLGIILGAFGSTASVKAPIQGITLTGVAAMAVALFLVLLSQLDDRYVLIQLRGSDLSQAQVELVGDEPYLSAFRKLSRTHEFVIFSKEIKRPLLSMMITLPDQRELFFECIRASAIRPHLASGEILTWEFRAPRDDADTPKIFDVDAGRYIAENIGGCNLPVAGAAVPGAADAAEPSRLPSFALVPGAFAQTSRADPATVRKLLADLEVDAAHVRRDARSELAKLGVDMVEPVLAAVSRHGASYRTRLGGIVALTEMMRENKARRADIIARINTPGLGALVSASADPDRTIRIYASEFLYDLGDPRAIGLALRQFPRASDNGRYNLLLVVKGAVPYASPARKAQTAVQVNALKASGTPKTNQLIESIEQLAR